MLNYALEFYDEPILSIQVELAIASIIIISIFSN